MESLLYLGKVNFCWILFYGCYWLMFRKHTFFRWNRAYLLASVIISFSFPLITFSEPAQVLPEVIYNVSTTTPTLLLSTQVQEKTIPWLEISVLICLAGALVMFFRLLRGFYDLGAIIFKSECIKLEDYTIVLLPPSQTTSGSFSFFGWLVVSDEDYKFHLDTILSHESVHIRQWHSLDIIVIELLKTVFWFNPALWFYKNSLQEIHEFLADEQAPNKDRYATFLVSYALNSPVKSLTNHFFNRSLLKSRIKMIYKNRTSRWLLGKYMMIIPVALALVSLTAAREHMLPSEKLVASKSKNDNFISQSPEKGIAENLDQLSLKKNVIQTDEIISIKGIINDWKGLPVRNATIVVKNSKVGISSDNDGKFSLDNIPANSQIVVSHVSYKSAEFNVEKAKKNYTITLQPGENRAPEIVVVGFNTVDYADQQEKSKSGAANPGFIIVEQKAEFPGGEQEMMKYLGRNIKYPTAAMKANVSGTVLISFELSENGNVLKPKVIKGIGFGLDEEAARVVWNMPRWNPAKQNGEAVAVQYTIPIQFQIEKRTQKTNTDQPKENKENRQGFTNYRTKDNLKLADNKYVPVSDLGKFFDDSSASANELSNKDSTSQAKFTNYQTSDNTSNYRYNTGKHYKVGDKGYYSTNMPDGFQIPKAKVKYQKQ